MLCRDVKGRAANLNVAKLAAALTQVEERLELLTSVADVLGIDDTSFLG
jgi:hypothetical protein